MNNIEQVIKYVMSNNNFLILCHSSPDGDTLGSAYALCLALHKMGKHAKIKCADPIPSLFSYLNVEEQEFEEQNIISVDIADTKLITAFKELYGDKIDLNIDHHPSNLLFAKINYVVPNAAANCEIIYDLIIALGVKVDVDIANAIYTGLATDTGCFRFSNTTAHTLAVASECYACGCEHTKINRLIFETKTRARLAIEALAIQKIEYIHNNICAMVPVTLEMKAQTGANDEDLHGITALPRQIEGVLIGMAIKEKAPNKFRVSVRTFEPYNASELCAKFSGGGHARAAGCEILGSFDDVKQALSIACGELIGAN